MGHAQHHAHDVKKEVATYLKIFAALAILSALTVMAAKLDVSTAGHVSIAMLIAIIKGGLVAMFFMHLLHERRLTYWVLALTVAFFFLLLFLPTLAQRDHAVIAGEPAAVVDSASSPGHDAHGAAH